MRQAEQVPPQTGTEHLAEQVLDQAADEAPMLQSWSPPAPPRLVALGVLGEHNVRNALAAVTVLDHLGVPAAAIRRGIEQTPPPAGRLQRISEQERCP